MAQTNKLIGTLTESDKQFWPVSRHIIYDHCACWVKSRRRSQYINSLKEKQQFGEGFMKIGICLGELQQQLSFSDNVPITCLQSTTKSKKNTGVKCDLGSRDTCNFLPACIWRWHIQVEDVYIESILLIKYNKWLIFGQNLAKISANYWQKQNLDLRYTMQVFRISRL